MSRARKWTKAGELTAAPPKQAAMILTDYDWLVAHGWTLVSVSGNPGRIWSTYRHADGRRIQGEGDTSDAVDVLVRREVKRQDAAG